MRNKKDALRGLKKFRGTTIGMQATYSHPTKGIVSTLIRVHYYDIPGGVLLVPASGHSLEIIKPIKQVEISDDEYNNRDYDYCDDEVEWLWAINKLGLV